MGEGGEKNSNQPGEGTARLVKIDFRVFVLSLPFNLKIAPPPLFVLRRLVFIGEMLLGFSTWSLNFFLFVNFDFSYFFLYFFENDQYQRRLKCEKSMILKMTREKSNAFENLLTI